jgi:hypothetical protein
MTKDVLNGIWSYQMGLVNPESLMPTTGTHCPNVEDTDPSNTVRPSTISWMLTPPVPDIGTPDTQWITPDPVTLSALTYVVLAVNADCDHPGAKLAAIGAKSRGLAAARVLTEVSRYPALVASHVAVDSAVDAGARLVTAASRYPALVVVQYVVK